MNRCRNINTNLLKRHNHILKADLISNKSNSIEIKDDKSKSNICDLATTRPIHILQQVLKEVKIKHVM